MITRVTITGADDSVTPGDLLLLTYTFPFVEWGILISESSQGHNRFPSQNWLDLLCYYKEHGAGTALKLSAHLCGRAVRKLLKGDAEVRQQSNPAMWPIFERVQLNTHGIQHEFDPRVFHLLAAEYPAKEFIFQCDYENDGLLTMAEAARLNYSALFDLSHGAGIVPDGWPYPLPGIRCGYAGGLSPDNLRQEIERIEEKAGDTPVWIDMETHVRSKDDHQFDLDKVARCLEIAGKYVQQQPA